MFKNETRTNAVLIWGLTVMASMVSMPSWSVPYRVLPAQVVRSVSIVFVCPACGVEVWYHLIHGAPIGGQRWLRDRERRPVFNRLVPSVLASMRCAELRTQQAVVDRKSSLYCFRDCFLCGL